MKHIEAELNRIEERLWGGADALEYSGLYAAQQALRWAAQPDEYASPYAVVTRSAGAPTGYSGENRPASLSCSA